MSGATVAALTGSGRAAIHSVLIRGDDSPSIVNQLFRGEGQSPHGIVVGDNEEILDDAILIEWPGNRPGYLLSLHGSPLIRDRVIERCLDLGASRCGSTVDLWSSPGSGVHPIIKNEALHRLPQASSKEACAFLLEQSSQLGFAGWVEKAARAAPEAADVDQLLHRASVGISMLEAPTVVLAGAPNAGKSTLFNVLYGQQMVLTSEQPGTTRDLLEAEVCIDGFPIQVIDGAGLRNAAAEVEREGIRRMQEAMARADLVVYLVAPGDREPGKGQFGTPEERTLVVHSRRDETGDGMVGGLGISSVTGEGIAELQRSILQQLHGEDRDLGALPCPFLPRHIDLLVDIRSALDAGEDPAQLIGQYGTSQMGGAR